MAGPAGAPAAALHAGLATPAALAGGARADGAALSTAAPAAAQAAAATTGVGVPAAAQGALAVPAQAALADRAAMMATTQLAANPAAAASGTTAAATALAVPATGNPQAANPATVPVPAAPLAQSAPANASGNPMIAGGPAHGRGDGMAQPHGHTVAGAGRRPATGDAGSTPRRGLDHALALLGLASERRRRREDDVQEQADLAFQRLYWLLAIVAYASLGMMVVLVLPILGGGSTLLSLQKQSIAGLLAFSAVGFSAGIGAWLLARRLK